MLVFLGTHAPRMDEKGRVILPARYRELLGDGLVVTRGQERCLYVFPVAEFHRMHERLRESAVNTKESREFLRVFLSGASDEAMDKQGRITVPARLRSYAYLDRELAVIGMGTRAEIWDAVRWEQYLAEKEQAFSDQAEEVVPGLF